LTTCFENFIGNHKEALRQAQAGVDVIFDQMEREASNRNAEKLSSVFVDQDILGTFIRLDADVSMFRETHAATDRPRRRRAPSNFVLNNISATFSTVKEARLCWDASVQKVAWRAIHFPEVFKTLSFGAGQIQDVLLKQDSVAERMRGNLMYLADMAEQWYHAFLPLFERTRRDKPTSKSFMGGSLQMIRYLTSRFMTKYILAANDSTFGPSVLFQDSVHIISLARNVLEVAEDYKQPAQPRFVFDSGLVIALFTVAIRCRDGMIRGQAISLLWKYPRREKIWDSAMAATIATWLVKKEEESIIDGFIPFSERLELVRNDFLLSERKVVVQCSKSVDGSRILLPEVTLRW